MRSSCGFNFPVYFMDYDDKSKIAEIVSAVDSESITPNGILDGEYLYVEESSVGLWEVQDMLNKYINFTLKKYHDVVCSGWAIYQQLNAEGNYKWDFTIKNNKAYVKYISAPNDFPVWCEKCGQELDYNRNELTAENYKHFKVTCPNCGKTFTTYRKYGIEVKEYIMVK